MVEDVLLLESIHMKICRHLEESLFKTEYRSGKFIMQQQKWVFSKCTYCGGERELIESNEFEEIMQCKECGRKTLLIKKLREEVE